MGAHAQRRGPARRDVHGIVLLDKPEGLSSNQALQRVRGIFRARKAGHTGSLDPAATGLLPLCFGEATKVSAWLLDAEKEYLVRACLGERRDTGDSEGRVIETAELPDLDGAGWQALFARFTGEIEQVPPMYSALKKDGRRLYELAREGREVERAPRPVRIRSLQLIARESDELVFRVRCSKGTYVRTLVEDIAAAAGTVGYTRGLRRVAVGPFSGAAMVTLDALEGASAESRRPSASCRDSRCRRTTRRWRAICGSTTVPDASSGWARYRSRAPCGPGGCSPTAEKARKFRLLGALTRVTMPGCTEGQRALRLEFSNNATFD